MAERAESGVSQNIIRKMVETKKKIRERLIGSFGRLKSDAFYFESIEKYFRNKNHDGNFQVLTDKIFKD